MTGAANSAAILWTGGKDSAMALYEAERDGYDVQCLVTFAPPDPAFLAHPLNVIRLQAESLQLPHYVVTVSAPYEQSYEAGLSELRAGTGVDCVITGDIAEVDGQPNWIRERGRAAAIGVHTPLWGRERTVLLRQLRDRGFRVRVSCVDSRRLDASWVGRELGDAAIAELQAVCSDAGLDACGEAGEYHTLVVDSPRFTRSIDIRAFTCRMAGSLAYMDIREPTLAAIAPREREACGAVALATAVAWSERNCSGGAMDVSDLTGKKRGGPPGTVA